jgi:hypothetical protein
MYSDRPVIRRDRVVPLVVLTVVWIVQVFRATHGIDFNDEMGYYGWLVGLIPGGRLFTNDLFIQQNVYLLTYPAMKPYMSLFGWSGLIVAVRCVFALFVLWVFRYVRRALEVAGTPPAAASIAALCVTLAMPLANMYSVNYNSIGLGILGMCFAETMAWRARGGLVRLGFWVMAIGVELLAYPPLVLVIGTVLVARLTADRDVRTFRRAAIWLAGGATVVAACVYASGIASDLRTSFHFSQAFYVGIVLRLGLRGLIAVTIASLALLAVTQREAPAIVKRADARLVPVVLVAIAAAGVIGCYFEYVSAMYFASLCCFAAALATTAWPGDEYRETRLWVTMLFIASVAAVAGASSRGSHQALGPALLTAATMFAVAAGRAERASALRFQSAGAWTLGVVMVATLFMYFLANPYQDGPVWRQTVRLEESAALRHLWVTPEKAAAVRAARDLLSDIPAGSRVMVVGAQPWLYFATDTRPDTDMVFMHSKGAQEGFEVLAARLRLRRPEYILRVAFVVPRIDQAVDEIVRMGHYTCTERASGPALADARHLIQTFDDILPFITVCRHPDAAVRISATR